MIDDDIIPAQTLNSLTKYPSIPTYHDLQPNGGLTTPPVGFDGQVIVTEKIDGCGARIIALPDGSWVIGSRDQLLSYEHDYLHNHTGGLAAALYPATTRLRHLWTPGSITVYYCEVFGGRKLTPASGDYTSSQTFGIRLFDVAVITVFEHLLTLEPDHLAGWRERDTDRFLDEDGLHAAASAAAVPLTPRLATLDASELPVETDKTHAWITELLPRTQVALDTDATGRPEGIVLRTPDRATIAKARLHSYRRTANLAAKATG